MCSPQLSCTCGPRRRAAARAAQSGAASPCAPGSGRLDASRLAQPARCTAAAQGAARARGLPRPAAHRAVHLRALHSSSSLALDAAAVLRALAQRRVVDDARAPVRLMGARQLWGSKVVRLRGAAEGAVGRGRPCHQPDGPRGVQARRTTASSTACHSSKQSSRRQLAGRAAGARPRGPTCSPSARAMPRMRAEPSRVISSMYRRSAASNSGTAVGHWLGPWMGLEGAPGACGEVAPPAGPRVAFLPPGGTQPGCLPCRPVDPQHGPAPPPQPQPRPQLPPAAAAPPAAHQRRARPLLAVQVYGLVPVALVAARVARHVGAQHLRAGGEQLVGRGVRGGRECWAGGGGRRGQLHAPPGSRGSAPGASARSAAWRRPAGGAARRRRRRRRLVAPPQRSSALQQQQQQRTAAVRSSIARPRGAHRQLEPAARLAQHARVDLLGHACSKGQQPGVGSAPSAGWLAAAGLLCRRRHERRAADPPWPWM